MAMAALIQCMPTNGNVLNTDLINNTSLEQFAHSPTRLNNTSDLFSIIILKNTVTDLSTVPGISDHDAITFHLDTNKHSTPSVQQYKIPLYISQR